MKILRLSQVREVTSLSRATVYEMSRTGDFPRQVRIGLRASGWVESEVQDWLKRRVAERDRLQKKRRA